MSQFNKAPLAELIRLRSYSRVVGGKRETWEETCDRTLYSPTMGLTVLGKFTQEEVALVDRMQRQRLAFGSARWLWCGGTEWLAEPENFSGSFNCTSLRLTSFERLTELMNLAMMGAGTGAVLEQDCIAQLPAIANHLHVQIVGKPGEAAPSARKQRTIVSEGGNADGYNATIVVGDSREGWVKAYLTLLEFAAQPCPCGDIKIRVDLACVRSSGERLKGFGGTANPVKLADLFINCAKVLNGAVGRQLTAVEVCLLIDHAATVVVAGNVRRSAGIRQFSADDPEAATSKDNLWTQDEAGKWAIDPSKDVLRMANHTRVFHRKPSKAEVLEAVTKQFHSGEGAIQYAPEAIARANADLMGDKRSWFLAEHEQGRGRDAIALLYAQVYEGELISPVELDHRLHRYGLNPCGEIIGNEFQCNLASVHLNQLNPFALEGQTQAFRASALQAAALLQRNFTNPIHADSRDLDPIVGVSFTGAVTFFVKAFGVDWLRWWEAGRPDGWGNDCVLFPLGSAFSQSSAAIVPLSGFFRKREQDYLTLWQETVQKTVWEYCDRHGLKRPNRCTAIKPEGSQTLLSGAGCNGHHMPKGWHYIRRMTFAKNDPIALAAAAYGYNIVPGQADKDEAGRLLDDPHDPRCTEWLVEVPVLEEVAHLYPEVAAIDPGKFSALAQFDFYMQVQNHYATHNVSATIEFTEAELEPLADRLYQAIQGDEGYVSAALLARFEAKETYPRLPFEPISREEYDRLMLECQQRRRSDDFQALIDAQDAGSDAQQDAACEGGACEIRQAKPR